MDPSVRAFYAEGSREDDRLRLRAHGVLERLRTQELLRRFLPPPPAVVLDVGGGTGIHAEWLAALGYTVHLIDPVDEHIRAAAELSGVTATCGDARSLFEGDAGLTGVEVYGIEGPAGPTLRALGMDCLDERLDAATRAARLVERDPALIAASGHLLAVGRA